MSRRSYAFLGAGEFEGWHADIDRRLLEGRDGSVLVLATASAPEGDDVFDGWANKGLAHYRGMGVPVEAPALKTSDDARDPAIVETLDRAALVCFSGGNPYYLASVLRDSPFWDRLRERVHDGRTAYLGCSAGVACLSDPTFDTATDDLERVWAPGLGYFPQVLFAPHWDMVEHWISGAQAFIIASAPPDGVLIALDEQTAMVGDGQRWTAHGAGGIHVYEDRAWVAEHRDGASFPLPLPTAGAGSTG
jgi:cyanophycinase-like exopeptidase